jgi:hypothetical protein
VNAVLTSALSRLPVVTPTGRLADEDVEASGVSLPVFDTGCGGWGFHPLVPCPTDAPSYSFRIRLVCMLLDTSGLYFGKGSLKTKLDAFLTYFQVRRLWTVARMHRFVLVVTFWFGRSSDLH